MSQLPLQFDRKHTALCFVESKPDHFRADFKAWLDLNWHVYIEFEKRALRLWAKGRRHYGARSIWETMRYDSNIGELAGEWKLNDHFPPYCARLFMMMNRQCQGFFETRREGVAVTEVAA